MISDADGLNLNNHSEIELSKELYCANDINGRQSISAIYTTHESDPDIESVSLTITNDSEAKNGRFLSRLQVEFDNIDSLQELAESILSFCDEVLYHRSIEHIPERE